MNTNDEETCKRISFFATKNTPYKDGEPLESYMEVTKILGCPHHGRIRVKSTEEEMQSTDTSYRCPKEVEWGELFKEGYESIQKNGGLKSPQEIMEIERQRKKEKNV